MPASPVSQPGAFCLLCTVLFSFFPLFIIFFYPLTEKKIPHWRRRGGSSAFFFFFYGQFSHTAKKCERAAFSVLKLCLRAADLFISSIIWAAFGFVEELCFIKCPSLLTPRLPSQKPEQGEVNSG